MNQHEIRVWYFVGQYAAKPCLPELGISDRVVVEMSIYSKAHSYLNTLGVV